MWQSYAEDSFCWNAVPERWAYEITTVRAQINNADWLEKPQCRVGNKTSEDGANCAVEQVGDTIVVISLDHPPETPLIISAKYKRSRQPANTFSDKFILEPPPLPTPDQAKFDWKYISYIPLIIGFYFLESSCQPSMFEEKEETWSKWVAQLKRHLLTQIKLIVNL